MKVAIIGQSNFAGEVYKNLIKEGHSVVAVFTIPDQGTKQDPLASIAESDGVSVFKFKSWRKKGVAIPEVLEAYKSVDADLNVMPYCSQFIPMEVINHPSHGSICYHPSLLPRHRGASSINWTLMCGDRKAGFSIFWADDGLDTGPILLQKEVMVDDCDTVDTLYNRFMYPEGIKAMVDAVNMVQNGTAPKIPQPSEGATYDPMLNKNELTRIDWKLPAKSIHDVIRGMDSVPGASGLIDGKEAKFFGSRLWHGEIPMGREISIEGLHSKAIVHRDGLLVIKDSPQQMINIERLSIDGKMIKAKNYGASDSEGSMIELNEDEKIVASDIKKSWEAILNTDVFEDTDFFKAGAGSMDVVRLVEEVKEKAKVPLENDEVYMASNFQEFMQVIASKIRGFDTSNELAFDAINLNVNKMHVSFPHQLFIDGNFMNASENKVLQCINPANEELICEVQCANQEDVDKAVKAAKNAFEFGEWGKMNARDRGKLLYKLADVMDEHKEELATIESIDSGAVYTLALKTHVGMSIETWRYFAGWCDKIQGSTIPINNARPNHNLTITKKEPIGVCGLVTPWNYPLMMLSWKMAACLAAGNTVVIKPAQVSPLTALKFAELSTKAGIPPGVINVLPGTGSVCGQAISDHPLVRKLGFTGSTEIGKVIMKSCASNIKKVSLELGGKSPFIIFADCDFEKAVRMGMSSVFFNKGENCIAAGRIFVESSIHDHFVQRIIEECKKMVIGDPLNRSTNHGPQNHKAHFDKLLEYIKKGKEDGATLVYGGKRVNRKGYFLEPTVFTDVQDDMFIAIEESFGPIMVISKFEDGDVDNVIRRANKSEYGLASGVMTRDLSKAMYASERLEAGTCFVNTYNKTDVAAPFGGFKQSGFGKDLGQEALNEYLKTKTITFEY